MAEQWFMSDWHLFHRNIFELFKIDCPHCLGGTIATDDIGNWGYCPHCKGTWKIPARPFTSVEEMHSTMVERHNAVVRGPDHYHNLGDVTMLRGGAKQQDLMVGAVKQFNGHGRLVLGNHDHLPMRSYTEAGFEKIYGSHRIGNLIFSHWPLHPSSIGKGCVNVHGHIHTMPAPPGPYINISVEAINYTPISLGELRERAAKLLEVTEKMDSDPF